MTNSQKLVEQYVPLANKLAYKKKRVLPKFVDIEDLKSAAYLGLVEAASRYNSEYGVAFSTYAYPRIFGAIHDWLRKEGWGKRGEFSKLLSLDVENEECSLKESVAAKDDRNDDEFLEVVSIDLDQQAKDILRQYFVDSYSMKEVGKRFGVSESRISQLITQYKTRIRHKWSESELRAELAA